MERECYIYLAFVFLFMKYQTNVHGIQVEDQTKEVLWRVKKAPYKIARIFA